MAWRVWRGIKTSVVLIVLGGVLLPTAYLYMDAVFEKSGLPSLAGLRKPEDPPKKIVIYTRFFGRIWDQGAYTDLASYGCPETRCVFSFNRSEAEDADAVLFHSEDFKPEDIPQRRRPRQRYIWRSQEGPFRQRNVGGERHFYNWTYTYHRASELFFPYGALVPLQGSVLAALRVALPCSSAGAARVRSEEESCASK
nr:alpha-(1,3)-fucosyltransferase fut-3-like [Penaeus vannamei]